MLTFEKNRQGGIKGQKMSCKTCGGKGYLIGFPIEQKCPDCDDKITRNEWDSMINPDYTPLEKLAQIYRANKVDQTKLINQLLQQVQELHEKDVDKEKRIKKLEKKLKNVP